MGKVFSCIRQIWNRARHINSQTVSLPSGHCPKDRSPPSGNTNRIFLVGNEDVGKTTLVKQMQKLCAIGNKGYEMFDENWDDFLVPYSDLEREQFRLLIHQNALKAIATLIIQAKRFSLKHDTEEHTKYANEILQYTGEDTDSFSKHQVAIDTDTAKKIESLWQTDSAIRSTWHRRRQFRFQDSTEYFLHPEKLQEIASPNYIPSIDDILRLRKPTLKPLDFNFRINKVKFNIRDAGGQAEKRKHLPSYISPWLAESQPGDRNFILFVASLSDYNQKHPNHEDKTMLDESIRLLQVLLNMEMLNTCGFILFLNKRDVLQQKLKDFDDFNCFYHQYIEQFGLAKGPLAVEQAERVIAARFADAVKETPVSHDQLYCQFTCAVDTGMMETIFSAVRSDIINDIIATHSYNFP